MKTKIKKIGVWLMIISTSLMLTNLACKKSKSTASSISSTASNPIVETKETKKKIEIPIVAISYNEVHKMISDFKENKNLASRINGPELPNNGDIIIDQAQFLLEAVINYDFDYQLDDISSVRYETTSYDIENVVLNGNNYFVSAQALQDIYNQMKAHYNTIISNNEIVAAIDLQTYVSQNGVVSMEASAALLNKQAPFSCNYSGGFSTSSIPFVLGNMAQVLPGSCVPFMPNYNDAVVDLKGN